MKFDIVTIVTNVVANAAVFVVVTVVVVDVVVDTYEMIKIVKFDTDLIAQLSN